MALFLASTQLPKLFGLHGSHGDFWERSRHFLSQVNETHWPSLVVGLTALCVLLAGKRLFKNQPVALFVVIGGIVVAATMDLESYGVRLLGSVPRGLPTVGLPSIHLSDVNELLPLALACFLLGAAETAALGRMFASKHGVRYQPTQDFLALAAANLAASLGRGYPVSGGMSQSLVNESAGARTPLSGVISSLLVLIVVLFFSELLSHLPQPALAAIVLAAVGGLFDVSSLRRLRKTNLTEYIVAIAALFGVLGSGLLRGVLIGAIISLALLIHRASRPHVAVLGKIPGTRRYSDLERHTDNEPVRGVAIIRPEAGLVYFNIEHVCDRIRQVIGESKEAPTTVLLDLSATPHVDMQAAHTLADLADELSASGIAMRVVEARSSVRDRLRREGVADRLGGVNRFTSVADAIDEADPQQRGALQSASPPKPEPS